jgi:hypothetical protein
MSLLKPDRESSGLGIVGVGSLALLAAVGALIYALAFVHGGARARGQVVALVPHQDGELGTVYCPTFRFRDTHDTEHTVTSTMGSAPPEYRVGDFVRVIYRPESPEDAKIDSFWSVWGMALIPGSLGLLCLLVGILVLTWPRIIGRIRGEEERVYAG